VAAVGFASDIKVVHAFVLGKELKPIFQECERVVGRDRVVGREARWILGVRKPHTRGALQVNDVGVLVPRPLVELECLPIWLDFEGPVLEEEAVPFVKNTCDEEVSSQKDPHFIIAAEV